MASAAPSGDGGGDDKPPESAPASLDPPADPQRNGEPGPSLGDAGMSAMGMTEIPDNPSPPECGAKRALPSRPARCRACARRNMIRRGIDPGPQSDDELSALPSAPAMPASPVPGMELPDPPSAAVRCASCEHRKKIQSDRRLRRNSEVPATPPGRPPIPPLDDMSRLALEKKLRPQRGKKRPLSVEEERGYRQCDVGKKLMRHKWDGLRHKWAVLRPASALEAPGFARAGGRDLLEKMLLDVQKKLAPPQGAQNPGFGAAAGGRDLLEKMMLVKPKALHVDGARLAQKPSSSPATRVGVLHQKLTQMIKVQRKVLQEGTILQVSTKLMRVLCPEVGSTAAAGGGLDGIDWRLVEKAIDNLVNQTGAGMQDIVKRVMEKVFSKEILYDLIMACVGRYPKLLEDDKGKLTQEKYKQYQKQLELMVSLTMVYDNDPENFSKIMKLMCKIGECGPLPSEVIDDISPGLDPSTMEQLYTGMLDVLHSVGRASPVPISK